MWRGKPSRGLILRPIEAVLIPFSLFWAGFAVFWNVGVWTWDATQPDWSFRLFGIPFLIAGAYVTVGRFLLDIAMRRRLGYAVTNRRIAIIRGTAVRSLDIARLPVLDLDERNDGSGTIRFGEPSSVWGRADFGLWQPSLDRTAQFLRIEDSRSVYQLIQRQAG